jgi:hypothetical protein
VTVQTVIDMVAQNLPPEGNISLEVRLLLWWTLLPSTYGYAAHSAVDAIRAGDC